MTFEEFVSAVEFRLEPYHIKRMPDQENRQFQNAAWTTERKHAWLSHVPENLHFRYTLDFRT
jgi:hypothetical protein